jgi:hypothetical protein
MAQRHDGEYGEEREGRMQEQYGGRTREHERGESRGRHESWDPLRRSDPFPGRFGREDEEYPRFGGRRFRPDFDREESERGAYAGRGYDEPGWEHESYDYAYGGRAEPAPGERGRFGGSQQPSRERFSRGFDPRTRVFGSHDEHERGRFDRPRGFERPWGRSQGGYSDLHGGYEGGSEFGEAGPREFGAFSEKGPHEYDRDFGRGAPQGWREHGRFAGRGPKGYRRSDERIHEEVCELLTADPDIDAGEMTVSVRNGEVNLEGSVDSRWAKRHAEDVIERVPGVHQVHNRLQVRRGEQSGRQEGEHATESRFGNGGAKPTAG